MALEKFHEISLKISSKKSVWKIFCSSFGKPCGNPLWKIGNQAPPKALRKRKLKRKSKKARDDYQFFSINTDNLGLQAEYDASTGAPLDFGSLLIHGRAGGVTGSKSPAIRKPALEIHPNTRNIAGMLRYRLLALGVQMNFKDLLGYGCWCTFLIRHDQAKLLNRRHKFDNTLR